MATRMFTDERGVWHDDWRKAIYHATGKGKVEDPYDAKEAKAAMAKAARARGYTHISSGAGYIMPNGNYLDMSGAAEGGTAGVRAYDHRDAQGWVKGEFDSLTDAMRHFMRLGAIRIMPEGGGVDIARKPTTKQYATLGRWFAEFNGAIPLDLESPVSKESREYPAGTSPTRILNDIKHFYRTGTLPTFSDVARWHTMEAAKRVVDDLLAV